MTRQPRPGSTWRRGVDVKPVYWLEQTQADVPAECPHALGVVGELGLLRQVNPAVDRVIDADVDVVVFVARPFKQFAEVDRASVGVLTRSMR